MMSSSIISAPKFSAWARMPRGIPGVPVAVGAVADGLEGVQQDHQRDALVPREPRDKCRAWLARGRSGGSVIVMTAEGEALVGGMANAGGLPPRVAGGASGAVQRACLACLSLGAEGARFRRGADPCRSHRGRP